MSGPGLYNLRNPYPARLISSTALSGNGSAKDIRHIIVDLGNDGPDYYPGDSLGVLAENHPTLVDAVIAAGGWHGDELIGQHTLRQLLTTHDIAKVSRKLAAFAAERTQHPTLLAAVDKSNRAAFGAWSHGLDVLDLLQQYPGVMTDPADLVAQLRPITPRLYSIASSLRQFPQQVHLTVGVVTWQHLDRVRQGVASTWLGRRLSPDGTVPCYVHHSKSFKLPTNPDTNIIMIGPGTGIAPFRSFLQERVATQAQGKNWLFFGDQHRATDFLYSDELTSYHQQGIINRLSLAFSRDQEHKIYVQHRMQEEGATLWQWLEDGAHLYICGDAKRMAKDVEQMLLAIAVEHGGKTPDEAVTYFKSLRKAKRYQLDVYAV